MVKKFKAELSKSDDEKKVKLANGEIEVFECEHCKFIDVKKGKDGEKK